MGDREIALAHAQLSARQLAEGAHGAAFESIATALRLAPEIAPLWAQFSDLIRYFNLRHPVPPPVRELLARALEHPAVDPGNLVRPVTTLALSQPNPLDEPLLLRLLEDVVIRDATLERLITDARRRMLDQALPLPVMNAIARQCFNTEYVFDETEEERAKVAAITSTDPVSLARVAAYGPANDNTPPGVASGISSVSSKVQAQYEENPYPRWVRTQTVFPPATLADVVKDLFPSLDVQVANEPRILVAGCGTGQNAIATARRFAGAQVLAVDISRASLAYAQRKTRELGIENIEYRQADILALGALTERFDLIESSGVLHHLEDPFEGWRVLASLRKPGGLMRIGLYSEAGRRPVARARELIAAEGFRPDAAGIRACRAAIRARAEDPLLAAIARNEDFYSMSGCRDLLFHVQEVCFTLPQIEAMIARLGLRFLGFELPDSGQTLARYRARYADSRDLQSWHRFESEYPDTFARMYQFWVT